MQQEDGPENRTTGLQREQHQVSCGHRKINGKAQPRYAVEEMPAAVLHVAKQGLQAGKRAKASILFAACFFPGYLMASSHASRRAAAALLEFTLPSASTRLPLIEVCIHQQLPLS